MGESLEFITIILLIVVLLQAMHNSWLSWSLREAQLDVADLRDIMMLAAQGKVNLKPDGEDFDRE